MYCNLVISPGSTPQYKSLLRQALIKFCCGLGSELVYSEQRKRHGLSPMGLQEENVDGANLILMGKPGLVWAAKATPEM